MPCVAGSRRGGDAYNARVSAPANLRLAFRLARLALHIVVGVTLTAVLLPVAGTALRDRVIGAWSRRLLAVLGVRLAAGSAPPAGGALLVCNHVSWLDIYAILGTRRVHFVSKSEVRNWPVLGWLAARTGTLFVERARRADTVRINAEMAGLIAAGAWVAVFPEGTTTDGRGLKRFLPSLLQPAVDLACPVVPAALAYRTPAGDYSAAPAYIDDISLWQSVCRIAREPETVVELRFGEPIRPDGHRRELAAAAEAAVAGLLRIDLPGA